MKKIISSVLLFSLALTIVVSAMPSRQANSILLVDQQMTQIVGGKNQACGETVACGGGAGGGSIWACVGAALIGGVGIAGAVISMGTSSVIAIYGLSLVATGICAH